MAAPRGIADLCTWCGHHRHTGPCPRELNDHRPTAERTLCPCNRHRKENKK